MVTSIVRKPQPVRLTIELPSRDEAAALAELVKRLGYETVGKHSNPRAKYGDRYEIDVMWSAVCLLQRQLADAGYNPR